MRLVSVTLENFRAYREPCTVPVESLTTLIGRNDVGKSSVLEALEIFFNSDIVKAESDDCNVDAEPKVFSITCEFEDLPPALILDSQAETSLAAEYLLTTSGTLRIKKMYKCTTAKPKDEVFVVARHPTAHDYGDLLALTNTALKNRIQSLQIPTEGVQLNNNPSIRRAIWQACPDLDRADVEIPVAKEDGKQIWDKLSSHLPVFALFQSDRASRDSDAEVQDPMKAAIAIALAEPDVEQKLSEVIQAVKAGAVALANRTHETLSKIDANLAAQLLPEFKADPKWAGLFSLVLNDDRGIPVNKRGSGVRRLILVAFFRAEAERRMSEGSARNIIYAIEEPETSQHPHNQRILLESFEDLAAEPGCQVLLTTHSPGFASYLPTTSLRHIGRGSGGQPYVEAPSESTWEKISTELGVTPDNRVRVLVCVEGPNDVPALKALSHALHLDDPTLVDLAADPRVAFVVLGGGALSHWVNEHYLRGLHRPEVHLYDNDVAKYQSAIDAVNARTDGSWGVLTGKREIENYLHPDAIQEGLGVTVSFGDQDDVAALVAQAISRNQRTAKRKLALQAFPQMTAARIASRDPEGEIKGWMRRIGTLL